MVTNSAKPPSASSAFSVGAILFVLFKHKWKIMLVTLLSLGGAAAFYYRSVPVYVSEAKVLVSYVLDRNPVDQIETTAAVASGRAGEAVMKAEIDIVKSWDVAQKVVEKLGPERFAGPKGAMGDAIAMVAGRMTATTEKGGNVIRVTFQHSDPQLAKETVDELVRQYFVKHRELHRSTESVVEIGNRVVAATIGLESVESDLKTWKKGSNLPFAELSVKYDTELAKAEEELNSATVAYAEQEAWVNEVKKFTSGSGTPVEGTSVSPATEPAGNSLQPGETVRTAIPAPGAADPVPEMPVRDNKIVAEYQSVLVKLSVLEANSSSLLKYTAQNQQVKDYEARLQSLQGRRLDMESKYPYLITAAQTGSPGSPLGPQVDLLNEQGKLVSLGARIKVLEPRVATLKERSNELAANAAKISKAERDRGIKQKNFEHLVGSQVQAEANTMIPSQKMPGLGVIQDATPASQDPLARSQVALGIAAAGPVVGAVLVLIFGLLLNRSIKRPSELEEHLGVPLMMTIPFFGGRARRRLSLHLPGEGSKALSAKSPSTPWRDGHFIRPFAESIRDRLGGYFERNKLIHKPKLIGVTGFARGAGVSTLAGGLAAALSEIGDGRVLLVDMNAANGKAHSFSEGLPVISLNNAIKDGGGLQATSENLYLARAESAESGAGSLLLKKLFELLPNLKASEFDYMVFDLPVLTQTSPAAAMGGLMDSVLVVVEAEENSREDVKRGHRDLIASGANVSMIFNKARAYGPRALVGAV